MKDGITVGDLPKYIKCKVTGKKKKNIQKMLRGDLEVPCLYEFDIKGKLCCSHYMAPQRQTEVFQQNKVVSHLGYQKKSPFQDKQMSRKNNQILYFYVTTTFSNLEEINFHN